MFENGILDSRQAKLPERFDRPTLADVPPGTVWGVSKNSIWVDTDYNMWVNSSYPIYGDDYENEESFGLRIIFLEEGLILDLSGFQDTAVQPYFESKSFEDLVEADQDAEGEYSPIIFAITTKTELSVFKDIFEARYNKKLNGKPIQIPEQISRKKIKKTKKTSDKLQ